jgi:Uma2 family endonuclease
MDRGMLRRKINVDEYYRMAEDGRLAPDARVELIEGEIIPMPPIGVDHAWLTSYLWEELHGALEGLAYVRAQLPVHLTAYTEPQPDLVVAAGPSSAYRKKHPHADDILLAVEISDTSLRDDRRFKLPLYARSGVPELWIVDVQGLRMEVFRSPEKGSYAHAEVITEPKLFTIDRLPGVQIDLSKIFEAA